MSGISYMLSYSNAVRDFRSKSAENYMFELLEKEPKTRFRRFMDAHWGLRAVASSLAIRSI